MSLGLHSLRTFASPARVERELIRRRGFAEFARCAWGQIESSGLIWNWHLDAMVEHLEAVTRREIRDLAINVPPGLSKSRFVSILWPAWMWTLEPGRRFLAASYSDKVVHRDARKMREMVRSAWFQARWPGLVTFDRSGDSSDAVGLFENTARGFRKSDTIRGQWTGEHGDDLIVDDPIDPLGAGTSTELDEVIEWYTGTMPTRFRDHARSTRTLIMQRIHARDLTSEFHRAGAVTLCLPMRFMPNHPHRYARDPRTVEGELLCPARIPAAEVSRITEKLGPTRAAAQLDQLPVAPGGKVFKRAWFEFWTELPKDAAGWTLSVDCAFKNTSDSSYVVLQVWCHSGPNYYLVDQRRERMGFNDTVEAIKAMVLKHPRIVGKLIEDKANGPAVIETLKGLINGLVPVNPDGGKETRANAVQPLVAGRNVYLPHPLRAKYPDGRAGAPWVGDWRDDGTEPVDGEETLLHELTQFPKAATDDQVDAMTQYLNHASGSFADRLRAAMEAMKKGSGSKP